MSKNLKQKLAFVCVVCLMTSLLCGFSFAAETGEADTLPAEEIVLEYSEVPIYLDGMLLGDGLKIDDTTFVPIRPFCEALNPDTEAAWDEESETVTVEIPELLTVSLCLDDMYMIANGRYLYLEDGAYNINGLVVVPIRELCKAFGVEVEWDAEEKTVSISTEEMAYIESADTFYVEDDVYWLSRLINAEAGNQPLDGKIGVGNVVLNRVADPTCPDTIYDVIFDARYGVQFSVTETGGIYLEPNEESVIAAKISLEGYNVVDDSLFFLNPQISSKSWFEKNFTFVASIGDHVFYS